MKINIVSYREMPKRLYINGLIHEREYVSKPRMATRKEGFDLPVQDHGYICYGTRPEVAELYGYGPWLQNMEPFFCEVEREVLARWLVRWDELSPAKVILNGRKFTRAFDRYYFGPELDEHKIQFLFDHMASTYDADIDLAMNLGVNEKLLERIAEAKSLLPDIVEVLDYGVGTGICADARPQTREWKHCHWKITGVDGSRLMLNKAKEKLHSTIDNPDSILYDIRLVDDVILTEDWIFDAAMACFTVHYFFDTKPYENIYRLLKPGSPFVCSVLQNEIYKTERLAKQAGFRLYKDRFTLQYEVKEQPVVILTFIRP